MDGKWLCMYVHTLSSRLRISLFYRKTHVSNHDGSQIPVIRRDDTGNLCIRKVPR